MEGVIQSWKNRFLFHSSVFHSVKLGQQWFPPVKSNNDNAGDGNQERDGNWLAHRQSVEVLLSLLFLHFGGQTFLSNFYSLQPPRLDLRRMIR